MKKRFTLIELLVVIAIIAILMGMLVPAYSGIREYVNRAKCSSNMHQITAATYSYATASSQSFPYASLDNITWDDLLFVYLGHPLTINEQLQDGLQKSGVTNYFECPSDTERVPGANKALRSYVINGFTKNSKVYDNSYYTSPTEGMIGDINSNFKSVANGPIASVTTQVVVAADTLLIAERACAGNLLGRAYFSFIEKRLNNIGDVVGLHKLTTWSNASFLDDHVEYMWVKEIGRRQNREGIMRMDSNELE